MNKKQMRDKGHYVSVKYYTGSKTLNNIIYDTIKNPFITFEDMNEIENILRKKLENAFNDNSLIWEMASSYYETPFEDIYEDQMFDFMLQEMVSCIELDKD